MTLRTTNFSYHFNVQFTIEKKFGDINYRNDIGKDIFRAHGK